MGMARVAGRVLRAKWWGGGDRLCAAKIDKWWLEQMRELYDVQVGAGAGLRGRGRGEDGDGDVKGSHFDVWLMTNTSRLTYTLAPKPRSQV